MALPNQTQEKGGGPKRDGPPKSAVLGAEVTGRRRGGQAVFVDFATAKPHKYHSEKLYTVLNLWVWRKEKPKNPPFFRWTCYTKTSRFCLSFGAEGGICAGIKPKIFDQRGGCTMLISRRSFLKGTARAGAAALLLTLPVPAHAASDKQMSAADSVKILQATSEDAYLQIKLDSVSRSVYGQQEPSCLVLLGFSVTNRTSEPVWLYHLHGNPFGEYYDGSTGISGTFQDQAFQVQITRSDDMAQADQTTADGTVCTAYGVNPGETIEVTATGSMSSEAGTLTLTFTPPEQHGANAGAHDTTHTFKVEFSQKCDSSSLQMAYL